MSGIGYDPASRTLEVEFRNGSVYRYFGVSPSAYAALLAADSIGRHLNQHVRLEYRYQRV